jgi:hypothetical protein
MDPFADFTTDWPLGTPDDPDDPYSQYFCGNDNSAGELLEPLLNEDNALARPSALPSPDDAQEPPALAAPSTDAAPPSAVQTKTRTKKKNKVRKGDGVDSRRNSPDPLNRDDYPFKGGHFWQLLIQRFGEKALNQKRLNCFCKELRGGLPSGTTAAGRWNHFVLRRRPCAFAWLDAHKDVISDSMIDACLLIAVGH